MSNGSAFQIGTGDSQPKFRIKNLSSNGTYWPFCGSGPRFWGRVQWPPATNPSATGTTPASVCDSHSSRQARKRKICSCRWPRRGGDWQNKPRARDSRTPIELVPLIRNERGGYSQQHSTEQERQNPKISVPTLDDRRCRRAIFWISYSFSDSHFDFSISVESLSSARELFTRFDTGHICSKSSDAGFNNSILASTRKRRR
jgi:hypothetical protein